MAISKPYLGPCSAVEEGAKDKRQYQKFQLLETWTNSRLMSHGDWISPDEYFWTPDSFFEVSQSMTPELLCVIREKTGGCFYRLSLTEQCALLGMKYERLHPADMAGGCENPPLDASSSVEAFSFDFYKNQGYAGDLGEGASIAVLTYFIKKRLEAKGIIFSNTWYRDLDYSVFPHGIYKRHRITLHERQVLCDEVESVLQRSNLIALSKLLRDARKFSLPYLMLKSFQWSIFSRSAKGLPRKD